MHRPFLAFSKTIRSSQLFPNSRGPDHSLINKKFSKLRRIQSRTPILFLQRSNSSTKIYRDMERGCLTFAAASSTPPAAAFRRRQAPSLRQSPDRLPQLFRISAANFSSFNQNTDIGRANLSAKALKQSLSSNWDVCNSAPPSWLPRFEELDTTNMLLRQRIIFLGTQVSLSIFFDCRVIIEFRMGFLFRFFVLAPFNLGSWENEFGALHILLGIIILGCL